MSPFTAYLRARTDDELVALLRARPDLASPSPSTLSSLAVRATSRTSLERALASVDAAVLQVVEAVVALGAIRADDVPRAIGARDDDGRGVGAGAGGDAARARGAGDDEAAFVMRHVGDAVTRLLVFPDDDGLLHAAPGVTEVFGPYPAGLAPASFDARAAAGTTAGATAGTTVGAAAGAAAVRDSGDDAPAAPDDATGPDPAALLADAPQGARSIVDALLWGPPVGLAPSRSTPAGAAVRWLVEHGLLVAADARHVVLPRSVALALRGGRTHRGPSLPPPVAGHAPLRHEATVAAEAASAGDRVVRLVARLVRTWELQPPAVLRAGGLGVRELRRTAAALEVDEDTAAFVVELAGAAGLVADDGEEAPSFVPTVAADEWHARDLPARWALLARAWRDTPRTPWLVGSRDERGNVVAALDPELQRPWASRLRAAVLQVLADAPAGSAPDVDAVVDALRWRTPRAVPPRPAVEAMLTEATRIGVVGAGALTAPGRALVDPAADAAVAFAAGLPAAVDEILLQGDLTGIVPGRPGTELEELIDRAAHVESRGGALTVRFTPESVRRAFDQGSTAEALLAELATFARGGVPQPLEYLVRDAARRHGRLRVGSASSYVRADDPALLAGLADDQRLAELGLTLLAPTVLAAQASVRELLDALRAHGLAPVAEGPDGQVLHVAPEVRRVSRRSTLAARRRAESDALIAASRDAASVERLRVLVPHLRRAEEAAEVPAPPLAAGVHWAISPDDHPAAGAARGLTGQASGQAQAAGQAAGAGSARTLPRADGADIESAIRDTPRPAGVSPSGPTDSPHGSHATTAAEHPPTISGASPAASPPGTGGTGGSAGTDDPASALVLLREAAAAKALVWVELVGSTGAPQRRLVRPVRVDGGRLRAVDPQREAELTVAVHRIASVTPADAGPA